ncbi:MAG: PAS domain-containing sensor histidine kinase [Anaerolineae bacterium]
MAEERRRAEEIVERLPVALILLDCEMRITDLNPAAEEITGCATSGVVGTRVSELLGPEFVGDDSALKEAVRTGRPVGPRVTALTSSKMKAEILHQGRGRLLVGAAPIEGGYVLSLQEAEPFFQIEADTVSDLSHDLRAPLASIRAYTELLVDNIDEGNPDLRRQFLDVIDERTHHLTDLVVNLTGLVQWSLGCLCLTKTRFSLRNLAEEALRTYERQARLKDVRIVLDASDTHHPLVADREAVYTVLRNLISNAVRFSRSGGDIILSLRREGTDQVVRLTDSGWGIPAEDLPHIFDTFYRGQNVVSEGFEGSGLGLALAKAVVEAHDGKIDVESREGEGTSVTVRLDAEGGMTGPS